METTRHVRRGDLRHLLLSAEAESSEVNHGIRAVTIRCGGLSAPLAYAHARGIRVKTPPIVSARSAARVVRSEKPQIDPTSSGQTIATVNQNCGELFSIARGLLSLISFLRAFLLNAIKRNQAVVVHDSQPGGETQCSKRLAIFTRANNPNNPSKEQSGDNSAENGRIARVTCSDQRI